MNSKAKQVMILKDFDSAYIEQAILILRSSENGKIEDKDYIVREAREIILSYTKRLQGQSTPQKALPLKKQFYLLLIIAAISLTIICLILWLIYFVKIA